jgi:hypothetical protein
MTDTAYSKRFQREVDPEQYLQLVGVGINDIHSHARGDITCPICGAEGGTFVRGATNAMRNRRAHFRFRNAADTSNHHPACDYYNDRQSPESRNHQVYFSQIDKTKITKVIRHMVCAGIQEHLFTPDSLRQMRQWMFQKRVASTFMVTISSEQVEWLEYLREKAQGFINPKDIAPFTPIQATIPGFSWKDAIHNEFIRTHSFNLSKLQELRIWYPQLKMLHQFVRSSSEAYLIDPELLRNEYQKTRQLNNFIISNYAEFKNKAVRDRADGEVKLLAFSALLLFISDWNVAQAIEKFAIIANVRKVDDDLAANCIGLNPYLRYELAETAKKLQENGPFDYQDIDYWQVEQRMRHMYEKENISRAVPLPPLPADEYITQHRKKEEDEERIRRMLNSEGI